jgi:hypothetical protein
MLTLLERRVVLAIVAGGLLGTAARAHSTPRRIRGTIDSVDGSVLHVTSRSGEKAAVTLTPDAVVTAVVPAKLSDIKSGSYIGTAALPQPDGTQKAIEIHVFPESMRGAGEGFRPFDLEPNSTMTNGTVGDVTGVTGRSLTVRYRGGKKTISVTPETPIVTFAPGSRSMLVAGAHVIVTAAQDADGGLTANRILVGKDGLVPPM